MKIARWMLPSVVVLCLGATALAQETGATKTPVTGTDLIPRSLLFGNPERVSPRLSPDGKLLAYLAPVDGVMNIYAGSASDPAGAKPITRDTGRGIQTFFWAYNNTHVLYTQDVGGDENWKVFSVEVESGKVRDLTPFETIPGPDGKPVTRPRSDIPLRPAAQIQQVSHLFPDDILIGLNNRNPMFHDVHKVNVKTGEMGLIFKNDRFMGVQADDHFQVRLGTQPRADGGLTIYKPDGNDGWTSFQEIGFEDAMTTQAAGFNKDGTVVYMIDSRNRNTAALTSVDMATGDVKVLADHAKADAGGAMIHPTEQTVQAVSFNYLKNEWKVLDESIQADLDYLKTVWPGEVSVTDRTLDDTNWIVAYAQDIGAVRYYHYQRSSAKKATFLFSARPALDGVKLAPMYPQIIKATDGLDLVSYLTLPVGSDSDANGRPDRPLPLVLNVHGGPWARDTWGYRGDVQWLANRGYAVLQVNFRGSTGLGKEFVNAADREWGGKMQQDLTDAVNWAVGEKIADPSRVAIYGGSYGGYAVLAGMTFTPEMYACGVDIVGVANLNTFIKSIPPFWAPFLEQIKRRVGDFSTEEGQKFLASRSPVNFVDRIKKPLLIGQGANDPRVNQDESDQVVRAMKAKNIPVTYVLYPDEGHGFQRPANRMSFFAVSEAFLAEHLGGKYEPINDDFKGSSVQVPEGAAHIPGLAESVPAASK